MKFKLVSLSILDSALLTPNYIPNKLRSKNMFTFLEITNQKYLTYEMILSKGQVAALIKMLKSL